ncbi:glycosyltransferase family 17 protein [Sclerotinia borealis F-4128]|uniref:Glycosyltransferase family 17 protein n=1 Tax=Sclerotinia borealis (strain F-4128) TaxID=1432307 RepID=W9CE64_SCLBF|nr:glycosyltransferase family 17 protein [Sclerotinia borealis F-4128]
MIALTRRSFGILLRQSLPYVVGLFILMLVFYSSSDTSQLSLFSKTLSSRHSICEAHGWRPYHHSSERPRKIYDLFMLSSELDWLEIRLNTLANSVDYFVVVESNITFTGLPKPLHFLDNQSRFSQFAPQIIYHLLENRPLTSSRTWDYEDHQRNAMFTQVIPQLNGSQTASVGDVLIVSDIDEIPRPETLELLRICDFDKRLTLRSRFYYYGFQFLHKGPEWPHPQATIYAGPTKTILPADLRNGEGGFRPFTYFQKRDLTNASWHCSSCFATISEMLNKMASFSHTSLNREVFRSEERIVDRVRKGLDLWDRESEEYVILTENTDIPKWVGNNSERFRYMLRREGRDAGFVDYVAKDGDVEGS